MTRSECVGYCACASLHTRLIQDRIKTLAIPRASLPKLHARDRTWPARDWPEGPTERRTWRKERLSVKSPSGQIFILTRIALHT